MLTFFGSMLRKWLTQASHTVSKDPCQWEKYFVASELLISVCDSNALRMCQEKEMVRNFGTCRQ